MTLQQLSDLIEHAANHGVARLDTDSFLLTFNTAPQAEQIPFYGLNKEDNDNLNLEKMPLIGLGKYVPQAEHHSREIQRLDEFSKHMEAGPEPLETDLTPDDDAAL